MYIVKFTKEEKEAVYPQIASRLDSLNELLCKAGEKKDVERVMELSDFIQNIKSFYYKFINAKEI